MTAVLLIPFWTRVWQFYRSELDEDGQVEFKGNAKAFVRAYNFLSQVLPYANVDWEQKLSIFLNFLVPKLPTPVTEDLSLGIEGAIDMVDADSYRAEKQATMNNKAFCCPMRMRLRDRAGAHRWWRS